MRKMKKTRKIICIIVALVAVFAFANIASATQSGTANWSSSICYNQFTTTHYVSKPSGYWSNAQVTTYVYYPGYPYTWLFAKPKSGTTGHIMGEGEACPDYDESHCVTKLDITYYTSESQVKLLIQNPYSEYEINMQSHGSWYGNY
jgi:hypothetical protein